MEHTASSTMGKLVAVMLASACTCALAAPGEDPVQINAKVSYLPTELSEDFWRLITPNIFLAVKAPGPYCRALALAKERFDQGLHHHLGGRIRIHESIRKWRVVQKKWPPQRHDDRFERLGIL